MDSWTQQMGFPLITIDKIGPTTIRASQSRFLLTAALNQSLPDVLSPFGYKWFVPLSYYTDQDPEYVHHVWMNLTDGMDGFENSVSIFRQQCFLCFFVVFQLSLKYRLA